MRPGLLAAVPVLILAAAAAQAQTYRWVDEKGRVQYSDTPPAKAKAAPKPVPGATAPASPAPATSAPDAGGGPVPFAVQRAMNDFPVTLYSAENCNEGCTRARDLLNQRGVPFTEIVVTTPDQLAKLKTATGGGSVPAMTVGSQAVAGFEQGAYDALLDSAGYPAAGTVPPRAQKAPTAAAKTAPKPAARPEPVKTGPYDSGNLPSNQPTGPGRYAVPEPAK